MDPIRVVQMGLGPIGQGCVETLLRKSGIELVGVIDVDPEKVGRDVGAIGNLGKSVGVAVRGDVPAALTDLQPQVVVHTTLSFLDQVEEQLATIVRSGAHIVSSTEELFYPFQRDPDFCKRIDAVARRHNVAVVGTGVNPGFAMDVLPLCLTGVCTEVEKLAVTRVVDAGKRRLPFQRKVGAGITHQEFEQKLATGQFGHIGLRESALALMATLGWPVDRIHESIEPVIAENEMRTDFLTVRAGQVAGLHQLMRVISGGVERLTLDLWMCVGAEDQRDTVEIAGVPPISMRIDGGIFGDTATVAALVNTVPKVINAPPGLRTMMDLPMPYAFCVE